LKDACGHVRGKAASTCAREYDYPGVEHQTAEREAAPEAGALVALKEAVIDAIREDQLKQIGDRPDEFAVYENMREADDSNEKQQFHVFSNEWCHLAMHTRRAADPTWHGGLYE
jgi:8-oxo-dGTP pyrophosphatase MutT (NUDIX family)